MIMLHTMDRVISISRNRNLENPISGLKIETATPRKASALKDLTNKGNASETYTTPARKGPHMVPNINSSKQSIEGESAAIVSIKGYLNTKFAEKLCSETHTFPVNKNCYCCNSTQYKNQELWGNSYALREETIDSIIDQPLVFQESTENFLEVLDDAPTLFLEPEESYSEDEFQINPIFPQSDWEDSLKNSSKEDSLFEDPEMSDCSILSNWDDENCGAMHPTMSFNDSIF